MADEAHSEGGGLVFHPMDQFIVRPLFGGDAIHWYTPTNVTLWMGLAVLAIFALLVLGTSKRAIVPGRTQSIAEMAYGFIYKMVEDICGKEGLKYFPYIMTLFMFIVVANFLGLLPMAFTTTSHIAVTFALSAFIFVFVTLLAICKHRMKFFGFFLPEGTPWWLAPLMIFIELFPFEIYLTAIRPGDGGNNSNSGRFSCAVWTQHTENSAWLDFEADIINGHMVFVAFSNIF